MFVGFPLLGPPRISCSFNTLMGLVCPAELSLACPSLLSTPRGSVRARDYGPQGVRLLPQGRTKRVNRKFVGIICFSYLLDQTCLVLHYRIFVFSRCPGRLREVREAGRNHFHLSWYLSDAAVTSISQKNGWFCLLLSTVGPPE